MSTVIWVVLLAAHPAVGLVLGAVLRRLDRT